MGNEESSLSLSGKGDFQMADNTQKDQIIGSQEMIR